MAVKINSKKELLSFLKTIEFENDDITKANLVKVIESWVLHYTQACVFLGIEYWRK